MELYKQTFACILTDNGSEFADHKSIEIDDKKSNKKVMSEYFYRNYPKILIS